AHFPASRLPSGRRAGDEGPAGPSDGAEALTPDPSPDREAHVAVLFCDVHNFTAYCEAHQPEEVVPRLDALFVRFEEITRRNGLEKIKTIGDSHMAAANLGCGRSGWARAIPIRHLGRYGQCGSTRCASCRSRRRGR